ncbi:hypothetical protein ABT288_12315 [Streptomyces sp. NPDC001093]|uniref:hypothetical protein n=1 Tax=Streptomyces sp. NPDC001093 TaxID=3154376 RepID=UPI003328EAC7
MSRRGRQASLPTTVHRRPEVLSEGGLVVEHRDAQNASVRSYDFSTLPVAEPLQRSLAALFAGRCHSHRWASVQTSKLQWEKLRIFTVWLAALPTPPQDVDEITAAVWNAWRLSRTTQSAGYSQVRNVGTLLLDDPRVVGEAAEAMAKRISRPPAQERSYGDAEFDQIKAAARRLFRTALLRIESNARHLELWRAGTFDEGGRDWLIGEALDCLARTGHVPCYPHGPTGEVSPVYRYVRALGGAGKEHTWKRLYLSRLEATSLGVLLMAEFGLNLAVIDALAVPLASADSGPDGHPTYRLELVKRRLGSGRQHETRNVTDLGGSSPGRLITQALAATRFAREAVEDMAPGTNRLIIWRSAVRGCGTDVGDWFRLGTGRNSAGHWAQLAGVAGSPFRRGRRTVNVVERREPGQNSQDTHDRTYVLPDPRAQEAAVPVIAAAAEAARQQAERVVLAAELRDAPVAGDAEAATADCRDFDNGPFPGADGRCGAAFLACLGCTNARIHPGHHARLAHLHRALSQLRSAMNPALWQADWGEAHARLEHLSRRLGVAAWAKALAEVSADDRELIDDLLNGGLSA